MTAYCNRTDIDNIYGARSVARWADLDGDENHYEMAQRIDWACELATEYINSRLTRTQYAVPFDPVPLMMVNIAAMYAGMLLHDGRSVVSAEEVDRVSRQRKDVKMYIRQILRGQLKLLDPDTQEELDVVIEHQGPFVVTEVATTSATADDGTTIIFGG